MPASRKNANTSDNQMADDVQVEVNPDPDAEPARGDTAVARIPDRPDDDATVDQWRTYVVACGAHPDVADGLESKRELRELADRIEP